MRFFTHVNILSRRYLGTVGRPLAVGTVAGLALGLGVPKVTSWFMAAPVVLNGWLVLGGSVLAVIVTETGLWLLGTDDDVQAEYALADAKRLGEGITKNEARRKAFATAAGISEAQAMVFATAAMNPKVASDNVEALRTELARLATQVAATTPAPAVTPVAAAPAPTPAIVPDAVLPAGARAAG